MTDNRQIVFLGTPSAAATILERLVDEGFDVVHVVTRPDARRGRGASTSPSPVKEVATRRGIDVSHDLAWLEHNAHRGLLGVVVAYGRIIPARLLERMQMVNVHFSLLPRWRGAAPVERAILSGDAVTGVCVMELETTLDTGPVFSSVQVPIAGDSTAEKLTRELASAGARLLVETLRAGLEDPRPQQGDESYADKIHPSENRIEWARPAAQICRQVRALRAFTISRGSRLRVISCAVEPGAAHSLEPGRVDEHGLVGTSDGLIRLLSVQPEGRGAMDAASWLRGLQQPDDVRFD